MLTYYITATGENHELFERDYALLGLQRNLRILGIFARLCIRDGRPQYLEYVPRVWGHIQTNLSRLADPTLTNLIKSSLPTPTRAALNTLKAAWPTNPTQQ